MPDIAGALAEPPSVAVRAERRSGGVEGKDVQIIGGGTIGILTALVTKARKPRSLIVCEPDPIRRKRAADMGFVGVAIIQMKVSTTASKTKGRSRHFLACGDSISRNRIQLRKTSRGVEV